MMKQQKLDFLANLALLLDVHKVAIVSRKTGDYTAIGFQFRGPIGKTHHQVTLETLRCHITPHDLQGLHHWVTNNEN